jgi:hypothetical protein
VKLHQRQERRAELLLDVAPREGDLVGAGGLRRRGATELRGQLAEDDLLRAQRVAGGDQGGDLSFCCWVNVTPTRPRAVMPLTGSLSALPTWMEADLRSTSPPDDAAMAAAMSVIVRPAWSKILLPLPTSLRTFLKVRSMLRPEAMVSSSIAAFLPIELDSLSMSLAVTLAAPPVALIVAAVSAPTFCDSRASRTSRAAAHPARGGGREGAGGQERGVLGVAGDRGDHRPAGGVAEDGAALAAGRPHGPAGAALELALEAVEEGMTWSAA